MLSQRNTTGRELTHPNETRDCTVVALANAAGITYVDAHKFTADAGRKPNRGMKREAIKTLMRNVDISGVAVTRELTVLTPTRPQMYSGYAYRVPLRRARHQGVSVASFIRTLPKRGRFYLACITHAFAYINGVVVDNLHRPLARATMYLAYEIVSKAEVKSTVVPVEAPITQAQTNELWERLNKLEAQWKA